MRTQIQKWGNSLALRIPKAFASEAGLTEDAPVDITFVDGKLVIAPVVQPPYSLEALLAGITDENIHGEVDFGPPVGKEEW
jgi:antitoxin MazE